jgi:hypothetical protein
LIQNEVAENSPHVIAKNLTGIPAAWSKFINQIG